MVANHQYRCPVCQHRLVVGSASRRFISHPDRVVCTGPNHASALAARDAVANDRIRQLLQGGWTPLVRNDNPKSPMFNQLVPNQTALADFRERGLLHAA